MTWDIWHMNMTHDMTHDPTWATPWLRKHGMGHMTTWHTWKLSHDMCRDLLYYLWNRRSYDTWHMIRDRDHDHGMGQPRRMLWHITWIWPMTWPWHMTAWPCYDHMLHDHLTWPDDWDLSPHDHDTTYDHMAHSTWPWLLGRLTLTTWKAATPHEPHDTWNP
jgi:hypothetical protein